MAYFLSRTAPNTSSKPLWPEKKGGRNFKFLTKTMG